MRSATTTCTTTPTCIAPRTRWPIVRPRHSKAHVPRHRSSSAPRTLHEIVWTRGTTESINLVAHSYGASTLRSGDEILISVMEHHSNIVPWQLVAQRTGATVQRDRRQRTRRTRSRRLRAKIDRTHEDRRHRPRIERARHHQSDQTDDLGRARRRSSRPDRRRAGSGAPADRRGRSRLRLLRAVGAQDVRADRHRRVVRQRASARRECRRGKAAAR